MVNPKFTGEKSIILVDGNNLLIRILYAANKGNNLLTPRELIEKCAQIFMHQLTITAKKYACDRLYVCFDNGGSLRKKSLMESYKGNRTLQATSGAMAAFNEPNTTLFAELKQTTLGLCSIFRIPVFNEYGIEADDFIGIAVEELKKIGKKIVILSNDSDFLQLLTDSNVICSIPYKKMDVTKDTFPSFFSELSKSKGCTISSSEYIFYKALVGDVSDNIGGIDRLGYKTLFKLMNEQLKLESESDLALYMTDTLAYAELLASRSKTELEKKIAANIDLIRRNYKLIELSSRYITGTTVHLTIKKLLEAYEAPTKMEAFHGVKEILGTSNLEFAVNTLFSLKSTYIQD